MSRLLIGFGGYDIGMVLVIGWHILDLLVTIFSDSATSLLLDGRRYVLVVRADIPQGLSHIARKWRHIATHNVRHMCGRLHQLAFVLCKNSYDLMFHVSAGRAPLVHPVALENEASVFCLF